MRMTPVSFVSPAKIGRIAVEILTVFENKRLNDTEESHVKSHLYDFTFHARVEAFDVTAVLAPVPFGLGNLAYLTPAAGVGVVLAYGPPKESLTGFTAYDTVVRPRGTVSTDEASVIDLAGGRCSRWLTLLRSMFRLHFDFDRRRAAGLTSVTFSIFLCCSLLCSSQRDITILMAAAAVRCT
jgi:hypothetical protein